MGHPHEGPRAFAFGDAMSPPSVPPPIGTIASLAMRPGTSAGAKIILCERRTPGAPAARSQHRTLVAALCAEASRYRSPPIATENSWRVCALPIAGRTVDGAALSLVAKP